MSRRSQARDSRPTDALASRMGPACLWIPRSLTNSPGYLHDGTELRLVLHLLLSHAPLHTRQDGGLEEVPPVVMERPEKELKQLCLHIRGGALRRHTQTLVPSLPKAQGPPTAQSQHRDEV